jgi:hypothetical protein
LILAEDVSNHKSLAAVVINVWRLILLARLAQKLPDLVEEAFMVVELAPRLDAQNEVEAALTAQELGQVHRRCCLTRIDLAARQLLLDAVVAYDRAR